MLALPFLISLFTIGLSFFGIGEFPLRFLSVLFNLLAVLSLYVFVNKHINLQAAVIGCV